MIASDDLSPRIVCEWLAPDFDFGRPLVGDHRLYDVYLHETRSAICVVLDDDRTPVTIQIAPAAYDASGVRVAGLDVSWLPPGPSEVGIAACRRLAERITARLGLASRTWRTLEPGSDRVPRALKLEIGVEPARFDDDPDAAALAQDARHYLRLYAVEPRAVFVRVGDDTVGLSAHYPRPQNRFEVSSAIYSAPRRWTTRRVFRRYLAGLGFAMEDDELRIVPTPATFVRARERLVPDGAPLRLELRCGRLLFVGARRWVERVARDDTLPVRVAPRWAIEIFRLIRFVRPPSSFPIDAGVLAHDMSLHAFGFHAIPRAAWRELTALATQRLEHGRSAVRLARFFEEDLTRACWDVWSNVERPNEFSAGFEKVFDDLSRKLDRI